METPRLSGFARRWEEFGARFDLDLEKILATLVS